jgi:hypothetical protein
MSERSLKNGSARGEVGRLFSVQISLVVLLIRVYIHECRQADAVNVIGNSGVCKLIGRD